MPSVSSGKYLNVVRECGHDVTCPVAKEILYTLKERAYVEQIEKAFNYASKVLLDFLMEGQELLAHLRCAGRRGPARPGPRARALPTGAGGLSCSELAARVPSDVWFLVWSPPGPAPPSLPRVGARCPWGALLVPPPPFLRRSGRPADFCAPTRRSIKRYFLMDQGDFFVHFMDLTEEELRKPVDDITPPRLEALLELALRMSTANTDPFKDDLKVGGAPGTEVAVGCSLPPAPGVLELHTLGSCCTAFQ